MKIEVRKIEFIQEFLKVQSEETIERLEKLLRSEQDSIEMTDSMTEEELNERVAKSEFDFKENRYKPTSEMLEKYK